MKKILALALLTVVTASIYYSCKKGPNDPFLSFKSRESRMVGVWKCTSYTVDGIDSLKRTNTVVFNPLQSLLACGSLTATIGRTKAYTLTLGQDGNYNWINSYSYDSSVVFQTPGANPLCKPISVSYSDSVISVNKGIWEFGGGVGQYNNKELLELLESTDEVTGDNFEIVECSSKQLMLQQSRTSAPIKSKLSVLIDSIPGTAHVYAWTFGH